MRTEEEFEDVLKDIETAIIAVYRKNRDLSDHAVRRALEAAVERYRAVARQHLPREIALTGLDAAVFAPIQETAERWLGRQQPGGESPPRILTADQILTCLRRLLKSVEFWNKEAGRQGYLNYVVDFLP